MNPSNAGQISTIQSSRNSHNLGCRLLKSIVTAQGVGNVFLSPFSISTALAIVYGGATSKTAHEFQQLAGFGSVSQVNQEFRKLINSIQNESVGSEIRIANSLWTDHKFSAHINEQFVNQAVESFSASLYPVNFSNSATVDIVNNWIKNATQGKIERMLESTEGMASLIINAIYFAGKWSIPFNSTDNGREKFYTLDNSELECVMMRLTKNFTYHETEVSQTIFLPYTGTESGSSSLAMAICLPKSGSTLMNCFQFMENIFQLHTESVSKRVALSMPRFSAEFEIDLKDVLVELGLRRAFVEGRAQFENIFPEFFIQKILHKAILEVDESGSKAAAVTAMPMTFGCAQPVLSDPIVMNVNSPFLVSIVDLSQETTLFLGGIIKPDPLNR